MQELVPALLQFLQTSLESDAFSDQPGVLLYYTYQMGIKFCRVQNFAGLMHKML